MKGLLRSVRWLAVVVWVGGIIFFAFVVAPVAFGGLPNAHEAGIVVRGTINVLHRMGAVCAAVAVIATLMLRWRSPGAGRVFYDVESGVLGIMLLATLYSQVRVLPAMERDRVQAGGVIDVPGEAPDKNQGLRVEFERLHVVSERLEGFVLICGLGLVVLMACEPRDPEARR